MTTNRYALKDETARVAEVCDQIQRARKTMREQPSWDSATYFSRLMHTVLPAKVEAARAKLELVQ